MSLSNCVSFALCFLKPTLTKIFEWLRISQDQNYKVLKEFLIKVSERFKWFQNNGSNLSNYPMNSYRSAQLPLNHVHAFKPALQYLKVNNSLLHGLKRKYLVEFSLMINVPIGIGNWPFAWPASAPDTSIPKVLITLRSEKEMVCLWIPSVSALQVQFLGDMVITVWLLVLNWFLFVGENRRGWMKKVVHEWLDQIKPPGTSPVKVLVALPARRGLLCCGVYGPWSGRLLEMLLLLSL